MKYKISARKKPSNRKPIKNGFRIRRIVKLIFMLLGLFGFIYGLSFFYGKFVITQIKCSDQVGICDEVINTKISAATGLTVFKSKQKLNDILTQENFAKSFKISYSFPTGLNVFIEKRVPVYAISGDSGWTALVDREGIVTDLVDETTLPAIYANRNLPNIGEKIDKDLFFTLSLTELVSKLVNIDSVKLGDQNLMIRLKDEGIDFIFPTEGDATYYAGALNLVLSRLNNPDKESTIEKSDIREIDFRYKNPVLRKK